MTITPEELDGLVYTQLLARGQELYADLEAAANKIGGPMGEMTRLYVVLGLLDYEQAARAQKLEASVLRVMGSLVRLALKTMGGLTEAEEASITAIFGPGMP